LAQAVSQSMAVIGHGCFEFDDSMNNSIWKVKGLLSI